MTFRQLLKRGFQVDAQTRARFDVDIRDLFFARGGYDIERCD